MAELLRRMALGEWNSGKACAFLYRFRSTPPAVFVEESFDDGKGHSDPVTNIRKKVDEQLLEKALHDRYIRGKPELGYVSDWEFRITELGEQVHGQLVQMADIALENLFPGKGMRACDVLPYLLGRFPGATEEWAAMVLEELVRRGYTEPYEQEGQKLYLRTQKTKL